MSARNREVYQYYERNTRRFLRLGKHDGTLNIHQALWVEGVKTQAEAVSYANKLMQQELSEVAPSGEEAASVLDLGCGVGSSLFYLASHYQGPLACTGVTLSPTQVHIARQRAQQLGLSDSCNFLEADFHDLPALSPVHLAFAIEAFLHATDAGRFFSQASGVLRKGGRLALLDDFLTPKGVDGPLSSRQQGYLKDFRAGWLAGSLLSVEQVSALAAGVGLRLLKDVDYTGNMALDRPRDRWIGLMIRMAGPWMRRSTYFKSLSGGYAKQQCLKQGLVAYRFLVFEKE